MSTDSYSAFAQALAHHLLKDSAFQGDDKKPSMIHVVNDKAEVFNLDLTPFAADPVEANAMAFFSGVTNVSQLLSAYNSARTSKIFEMDLANARERVSAYAEDFLNEILAHANAALSDDQAVLIADWVKHLDVYCAVKAVESFFYSRADLKLLEIAPQYGWDVIYDHMAIRCGSREHKDAERVADLLRREHGYVSTQFEGEVFYQFPDGWNAYPLYKMLDNGQALRVFIDQSDEEHPAQIIQHWNRVYGYTAHHLGIRATKYENGERVAVPLEEVMEALMKEGIDIMTPTGQYTHGLLQQVFTRPERNEVPEQLLKDIIRFHPEVEKTIGNAKLLELVSRKEMPREMAQLYYALYDMKFDPQNPLHSAPVYQYFLPAQAAHVIRTSQEVA